MPKKKTRNLVVVKNRGCFNLVATRCAKDDCLDQKEPEPKLNMQDYQKCEDAWKATLDKFGIDRPILSFEKMKIARLIKVYGWKATMYALVGVRFEPKTDGFDPSKHVGLSRVEQPALFEKFVNLACQKRKAPQ